MRLRRGFFVRAGGLIAKRPLGPHAPRPLKPERSDGERAYPARLPRGVVKIKNRSGSVTGTVLDFLSNNLSMMRVCCIG